MIVTEHFVYIHTSRHAGSFINRLIMEYIPGAQMLRYHGQLKDLPEHFRRLPVIGFVRNPWDWYISMYFDYRAKMQYVFGILSKKGTHDLNETIYNFVNLGESSPTNNIFKEQLISLAPSDLNQTDLPMKLIRPGITKTQFINYPEDVGYYSWLFQQMHSLDGNLVGLIGRFENLREELIRLFEETKTPITDSMLRYINFQKPANISKRSRQYQDYYNDSLIKLISEKDRFIIDRYQYEF